TGDMVASIEEIKEENLKTDYIILGMEDIEVEPKETISEIKITDLEKILKVDEETKYQMDEEVDHKDLISDEETDSMIFRSFEVGKHSIKELERESDDRSKAS
ncbi:hypothetical protein HAX54_043898, partial [Datura stramonium]|nr:hypothetical protein [Datura stramonium]